MSRVRSYELSEDLLNPTGKILAGLEQLTKAETMRLRGESAVLNLLRIDRADPSPLKMVLLVACPCQTHAHGLRHVVFRVVSDRQARDHSRLYRLDCSEPTHLNARVFLEVYHTPRMMDLLRDTCHEDHAGRGDLVSLVDALASHYLADVICQHRDGRFEGPKIPVEMADLRHSAVVEEVTAS